MKKYNSENSLKRYKNPKGQTLLISRSFKQFLLTSIMLMVLVTSYSQKDVTQFLGVTIDGYKDEMIKKLNDKGFKSSTDNIDVLVGEFNGSDVNVHIVTNNNKVYRIMVADANPMSEGDIKIRFNKLCQQFGNSNKYFPTSDSILSKYTISDSEDISYEMTVNNKRYEAVFYQKTAAYDSLTLEMTDLIKKEPSNDADKNRLSIVMAKMVDNIKLNKVVWFMINKLYGKYYIAMYYDNTYNKANGEDL
jgi:hypothetical protein